MLALLTRTAHDSYADELARPGVAWLVMEQDGSLTGPDGSGVPWPEARPDVAWGTSDLFREGAPVAAFSAGNAPRWSRWVWLSRMRATRPAVAARMA